MTHLVDEPKPRLILGGTPAQLKVLMCLARFIMVIASRRLGKTILGCLKILKQTSKTAPEEDALIWWVAPTYRQSKKPFRVLARALRQHDNLAHISRSEMTLITKTGWTIEFRSADQPDNLLGEGLYGLVGDEIGVWKDEVYDECLRPMLANTGGWFLGIGTPRGKQGVAFRLYNRGQDRLENDYRSFKFTIDDAEFISHAEREELKRMPNRAYRQEFMAEFLDVIGVVFEMIRSRECLPIVGEAEGIGVDWAKKVDYTVFTAVGARSGAVKGIWRFNKIAYPTQADKLVEFCKWRKSQGAGAMTINHDRTGVGEALDDLLRERKYQLPSFEGITLTQAGKDELVQDAIAAFEAGSMGWAPQLKGSENLEIALQEHEMFTSTLSAGGKVHYSAPDGAHDDTVMSLVLAHAARRVARSVVTPRITV